MNFCTTTFLLTFLPLFLVVYYITPKKLKNAWLLIASIFFYSWGAPKFIFLLLTTTLIDFFLVRKMDTCEKQVVRKRYMWLAVGLNLGILIYFKYANFFIDSINAGLVEMGITPMEWLEIAFPVGISFYTFETITYIVDVYRRENKPLKNFWDYQLYIIFFPKLIAGPIVRFQLIADQITQRNETINDCLHGFYRFCIGLGKKILIANILGKQAELIFTTEIEYLSSFTAWIGIILYTFQIYFDFSGYTDMALGLARMVGIRLPENFNNPYNARSISDFWSRWHMTLGMWMKNYLYIPLGGNRVGKVRLYFNLWLVFLISGFWHGASWNFIIWGAYHGIFLILDRLFLAKLLKKIGLLPSVLFTFFVVAISLVFFRFESFELASNYLVKLFTPGEDFMEMTYSNELITVFILAVVFSFSSLSKIGKAIENYVYVGKDNALWFSTMFLVSCSLFLVSLSYITSENFNPFIYFRF